ncbi:MAG TPA: PIN domain-containing protein [Humisphaera sp.]|nr:PIN domain-containing protein [Humisphaera sp.]
MRTVFADTFYFLALLSPSDQRHAKAVEFTSANAVRMITTDWVLTELADGLAKSPRGRAAFLATLADLQIDADATIVSCESALMADGVHLYEKRPDKKWSLTDCISFVVMTRAGITEALTGDHHFEQAGFVALLR